jgi:hypothetical protein
LQSGSPRAADEAHRYANDPKLVDGMARANIEDAFTDSVHKLVIEHRAIVPGLDLAKILKIG